MSDGGDVQQVDEDAPPDAPDAPAPPEPSAEPEVRSWGWHLLQVSSWLLVVLVPIHLYTTWLWHDPGHIGVATFVDRWRSGAWRAFDWAFVVLALLHGGLGLDGLLRARIGSARGRTIATVVVAAVFGALGCAVSVAVLRFDAR